MKHKEKEPKLLKRNLLKVTFQDFTDAECVALGALGMSNKCIMRETKLTNSQITYRLGKAKRTEGNADGYRVAWRNGTSPVARQIRGDYEAVLRQDIQRRLPQQILRPTPEVVK